MGCTRKEYVKYGYQQAESAKLRRMLKLSHRSLEIWAEAMGALIKFVGWHHWGCTLNDGTGNMGDWKGGKPDSDYEVR